MPRVTKARKRYTKKRKQTTKKRKQLTKRRKMRGGAKMSAKVKRQRIESGKRFLARKKAAGHAIRCGKGKRLIHPVGGLSRCVEPHVYFAYIKKRDDRVRRYNERMADTIKRARANVRAGKIRVVGKTTTRRKPTKKRSTRKKGKKTQKRTRR